MWYEDIYKLEMENKKDQHRIWLKNEFEKKFQDVLFDDLIEQNNNFSTNDGCYYYRHKITSAIYSWSYIKQEWKEYSKMDVKSFSHLYDILFGVNDNA